MSRYEQRENVLMALALLVEPVRKIVAENTTHDAASIRAAYGKDISDFLGQVIDPFVNVNGVRYSDERAALTNALGAIKDLCGVLLGTTTLPKSYTPQSWFNEHFASAKQIIRSIPCDVPGFVLKANTPFQSYRRLHAIIQGATRSVELFDPFLDVQVYRRYFDEVETSLNITVVTSKDISDPRHSKRRDRIVAVSELFAAERPTTYRLLAANLHDRHLRVDHKAFHLGGSAKDMAKSTPYAVTNIESESNVNADLDDYVSTADEWYGPTMSVHRRS